MNDIKDCSEEELRDMINKKQTFHVNCYGCPYRGFVDGDLYTVMMSSAVRMYLYDIPTAQWLGNEWIRVPRNHPAGRATPTGDITWISNIKLYKIVQLGSYTKYIAHRVAGEGL